MDALDTLSMRFHFKGELLRRRKHLSRGDGDVLYGQGILLAT